MKRWTSCELELLKNEYNKRDGTKQGTFIKDLSKKLGKSESAVRNKAYELGITKRDKYYTKEQIDYLKENYDKVSIDDMAIILKKDASNLHRKLKELGLKKTHRIANQINKKNPHKWTNEEKERLSLKHKETIKIKGHPKGFLNHHHSNISKDKIAIRSKQLWDEMTKDMLKTRTIKQRTTKIINGTLNPTINQSNPYSRTKGGKRKDLNNTFFRSAWEANIARYYNFINVKWEFEPKTFVFENITRGSVSYTPDFYLPELDKWVEVKGWMDGKSKTKLKRFKQQYPEEYKKLQLITQKEYNEIKRKVAPFIKEWE